MSMIEDPARNGFVMNHVEDPLLMKYKDFTNHARLHSDQLRLKMNSKLKEMSEERENVCNTDYNDRKSVTPTGSPPMQMNSQEMFQEASVMEAHRNYPRARMSMITDTLGTEPSKLLREMLQNKENVQEEFLQNNNVKGVMCSNENDQGDSGCTTQDNGTDSDHSEHTEDLSGDESDVDSAFGRMLNEDNFSKYNSDENQKRTMSPDDSSKEAKRARVENIITSMRTVPNKRKQYQPQQHEMRFGEQFEEKAREVERESLREQLAQLQHQLTAVQQKYVTLYDKENDASSTVPESTDIIPRKNEFKSVNGKILSERDVKILNKNDSEKMAKDTAKLIDNFDLEVRSPADIEKIQQSLKLELANVVNNTVDSIFNKVVVRKLVQTPKPIPKEETSKKMEHFDEIFKPRPIPLNTSPREKHFDETFPFLRIPDSAFKTPEGRMHDLHRPPHHSLLHMPFPYYPPSQVLPPPLYSCATEPEQTEAIPLVVNTPKKKRTKVTDTRISNRAARELISRDLPMLSHGDHDGTSNSFPPMLLPNLPTSVAIPNPSLRNSDILSFYSSRHHGCFGEKSANHSPIHSDHGSPDTACHSPSEGLQMFDSHGYDGQHIQMSNYPFLNGHHTSTLTPMHLRKAKLMFFYLRYPSSAILKAYFPDVKFNKNNTAQLVKWFSNFREFFYIQMEKYARQAIAEQTKHSEDIVVNNDSEIYRVLNLHYNRNNQIEVPDTFRIVVQSTLREFFKAVTNAKDNEPSWKKSIYKVIARMDDVLPEFFKSANWMDQLNDL